MHPPGAFFPPHLRTPRAVGGWLLLCCALVVCMTVLGGVTRLAGAGLSMVEWRPFLGSVPPLSAEDWRAVFLQYQQFPEYRLRPVDLAGFKLIFWIEYAHRLLGRVVALVFLIPFLFFLARRRLPAGFALQLALIFLLGAAQGALGWFMVQSGLVDNPRVSPLRLSAHLALALALFVWLWWLALHCLRPPAPAEWGARACFGLTVTAVVFATAAYAGLVAGSRAGFVHNTFPLMGGHLLPPEAFAMAPWWRNFLANAVAIQFTHRAMALLSVVMVMAWALAVRRRAVTAAALAALAAAQAMLGVATLVHGVPTPLAAAHQGGALLLLGALVYSVHREVFALGV